MTEPTERRGGKRAGSGRKPMPNKHKVELLLPERLYAALLDRASAEETTRVEIIRRALSEYLK